MQQIIFFMLCTLLGITLVATALLCYCFDFFNLLKELKMFRELDRENLYGIKNETKDTDSQNVLMRQPGGQIEIRTTLTGEETTARTEDFEAPVYSDTRLDVLGEGTEGEKKNYIQFREKTADLYDDKDQEEDYTHVMDDSMIQTSTVSLGSYKSGKNRFKPYKREEDSCTQVLSDERLVCATEVLDEEDAEAYTGPEVSNTHTALLPENEGITATAILDEADAIAPSTALLEVPGQEEYAGHTALLGADPVEDTGAHTALLNEETFGDSGVTAVLDEDEISPVTAVLDDEEGSGWMNGHTALLDEESFGDIGAAAVLDEDDDFEGTAILDDSDELDIITALLEMMNPEVSEEESSYGRRSASSDSERFTELLTDEEEGDVSGHTAILEDDFDYQKEMRRKTSFTALLEENAVF